MRLKYNNVKVEIDGHTFDSKKEGKRYSELKILEKAGVISHLKLQHAFELIPAQKGGLRKELPMSYLADFVYFDNEKGIQIIEDVKGVRDKAYIIKRKLMKLAGLEITEI